MRFELIATAIFLLWAAALLFLFAPFKNKKIKQIGKILVFLGIILLIIFISNIWITLGRAPLRTLGETRLWYSFFLASIGMVIYYRWKMQWMILFSLLFSSLF